MDLNRGYIKLFRKIDNWEWYTEPNTIRMFLHCLIKANHSDKIWRGVTIPAGSFVTSRATLAKELKMTERQVRTAINHLKTTNELTSEATNHYSIITVNNWHLYQINDQQNDRQEVQQTTTTNNIYKNNIVEISQKFKKPTVEEIQKYCSERGNSIDAEYFYNYYESKGWLVGKTKMKDFRAAIRNWESRQSKYYNNQDREKEVMDYANTPYRAF